MGRDSLVARGEAHQQDLREKSVPLPTSLRQRTTAAHGLNLCPP
jgi:hypothetical protein